MKLNGRVWYSEGSPWCFSSREEWEALPTKGVVRIAQPGLGHMPGSGDLYWMDADGYVNHSNSPMALRARSERLKEDIHVKYGETVSYKEYKALDLEVSEWFMKNGEDCGCG